MKQIAALVAGAAAWAGVIAVALYVVFNIGTSNQVLMFLPIAAAVVAAWGIGELVTRTVFTNVKEKA